MTHRGGPRPSEPARDLADVQHHLDHLRAEVVALTHGITPFVTPRSAREVAEDLRLVAARILRVAEAVREE